MIEKYGFVELDLMEEEPDASTEEAEFFADGSVTPSSPSSLTARRAGSLLARAGATARSADMSSEPFITYYPRFSQHLDGGDAKATGKQRRHHRLHALLHKSRGLPSHAAPD